MLYKNYIPLFLKNLHTFLDKAYELKIVSTYYCNLRNFILKHSFENNNAIFFVDDISSFQDIIYFNVVEYGMDKEGAINSKGKQIYAVYDELLSQI